MFLCLNMHWHINVRSDRYIIVVSSAAYYMTEESNKEVKVHCHHFVKVFHMKNCFTY